MISKAKIRYIRSLEKKKVRNAEHLFVAEGPKIIHDISKVISPQLVLYTQNCLPTEERHAQTEYIEVSAEELAKASFLQHPQNMLAIFPQFASQQTLDYSKLYLAVDGVQDPGNMGTIIRIADWFGIESIFCSEDTVDVYNPKVVQATMGSIAHVNVAYTELSTLLEALPNNFAVYGTMLDGVNVYQQELSTNGIIIVGNEGNGISQRLRQRVSHRLLIPTFPYGKGYPDSLNVAIATAIICNEFRRKI